MSKSLVIQALLASRVLAWGALPDYPLGTVSHEPLNIPMDTCSHVVHCLSRFPIKVNHTFPQPFGRPPTILPGISVDPGRVTYPGDPNCPSGTCIILDPQNICDANGPQCLPVANIRLPYAFCDPRNPRCPPGGILVNPDISCHPLDNTCPSGGVIVNPKPCLDQPDCPCGSKLPGWITSCEPGTAGCNHGNHITRYPQWPPIHEHTNEYVPGYVFDPSKICNPNTNGCWGNGIVVVVTPACDARYPGCLATGNIHDPVDGSGDPACPPGAKCIIVNRIPCHPNDPHPQPGCIKVDPIPCIIGLPGCPAGMKLPDPIQTCEPGQFGCSGNGIRLPCRPIVPPTHPVIPARNPALVYDPNGKYTCSFIEAEPHTPPTPQCPPQKVVYVPQPPTGSIKPPQENNIPEQKPLAEAIPEKEPEVPKPVQEDKPVTQPETIPLPPPAKEDAPVDPPAPAKPNSKFPCSEDESNPCRGGTLADWQKFSVTWNAQYARPGPPAPFIKKVNFDTDGILVVTDDENKAEHFEVKLDGKVIGETKEDGFDRWQHCGKDADACIKKGWSHGYFPVPKGEHELSIQWTKGDMKGWWYGAGQYRLDKVCTC